MWRRQLRDIAAAYYRTLAEGSVLGRNPALQLQAYGMAWRYVERLYEAQQGR